MAQKFKKPIPASPELWLAEISMAYKSAEAFIQSGMVPASELPKVEPWHMAPLFCLVSREATPSDALINKAGRHAYLSFDEAFSPEEAAKLHPVTAFTFCYLEAHRGLGLIGREKAAEILALVESNESSMDVMLAMVDEIFEKENPFDPALLHKPPSAGAPGKAQAPQAAARGKAADAAEGAIYTLEITLLGIEPPIWRRVAVPGSFSLARLHEVVQAVMNFDGGFDHLHVFKIAKQSYGPPELEDDEALSEAAYSLCDVAPKTGRKILYTYDLGDYWEHELVVKKIEPPQPGEHYPRCLDGRRAAPPDDCGGAQGYAGLLRALRNPHSEDYEIAVEWLGEDYDPEAFDLEQANKRLQRLDE